MSRSIGLRTLTLALLLLAAVHWPAPIQARDALTMEGKTGLYQRVLTRPGAALWDAPGRPRQQANPLAPLSLLYVFDRRSADGRSWIEVGSANRDTDAGLGWLPAEQAIDWRQTLTVAFARTADRDPALFFRDRDRLTGLLESGQLTAQAQQLRAEIRAGQLPPDFPVIAREPDTYVDPNRQFYLLPILGHEEVMLESGHSATVLEVAAVTLEAGDEDRLGADAKSQPAASHTKADYRVGVVFVIDTTKSMGPYIERTRQAVRRLYERLQGSAIGGGAMSCALVAYRSNLEAAPGLEYLTRTAATLKDGLVPDTFFARIARISEAKVSSKGFDEDAYAGIYEAIEGIDWSGYAGRFIVLITDAGAIEANDPLSHTRLGAERLRLLAQEKDQVAGGSKIAIAALHLLTSAGQQDHAKAAAQYRTLTRWGDAGDLYFPVEGGSVDAYGAQVDALADTLLAQIKAIRAGQALAIPAGPRVSDVTRKTAVVGRAIQWAYLGREQGSRAPRLVDAWVSDRDLINPTRKSLEVRVLITKNQLSDLQETLQAILGAGESTFMSPKDFFAQLRGAAAVLARSPDQVNQVEVKRLADVGLIGQWLDDLPYTSQIMNLTETRWLARSYAEQQEVLDSIEEKIRLYRQIHDETDRWISLAPDAPKGETVTTIPLDALP